MFCCYVYVLYEAFKITVTGKHVKNTQNCIPDLRHYNTVCSNGRVKSQQVEYRVFSEVELYSKPHLMCKGVCQDCQLSEECGFLGMQSDSAAQKQELDLQREPVFNTPPAGQTIKS